MLFFRLRQSIKIATPTRPATAIDPTAIPAAAPAVRPPSPLFAGGGGVRVPVEVEVVVVVAVPVELEEVDLAVLVAELIEEEDELKPGRRF